MITEYIINTRTSWQVWDEKSFRIKLLGFLLLLAIVLTCLPIFFHFIEKRPGIALKDPLLDKILPLDVSIPVFLIIWTSAILMFFTMIRNPKVLLSFLASYKILTTFRMAAIYLIPLEAPLGLIPLKDPLSNSFYGSTFIMKDLFFSGHTSTLFLIFLCMDKPWQKLFCLAGVCILGLLLLVQHVHYTIDIIFAFPFAYLSYLLGKKFS